MTEHDHDRTIVIAGAGYAGLHIAQRLGSWLDRSRQASIVLIDRNDYHQLLTELPRVVSGARPASNVRVPIQNVLPKSVRVKRTEITGFDLSGRHLQTSNGPLPYWRLVLALGSRPNDFQIPRLAERALFMWSANDAIRVRAEVESSMDEAASSGEYNTRARLMTVVIGGAGATGVELAGGLAEELPRMAKERGITDVSPRVIVLEAGHTILGGSSPDLVHKALDILGRLHVQVLTNSTVAEATSQGLVLTNGQTVDGGVIIWAGGVKAPAIIAGSGLSVGYNGRVKVDRYLRALEHEDVYVAGDLASVPDPETGMALPPLAQTALSEGEVVASNLRSELEGHAMEPFRYRNKGIVVSVGERRGVANLGPMTVGGGLAHALKDAIEWEYRQSVRHLRGWAAG